MVIGLLNKTVGVANEQSPDYPFKINNFLGEMKPQTALQLIGNWSFSFLVNCLWNQRFTQMNADKNHPADFGHYSG